MPGNPTQLATIDEANAIAAKLGTIGGGVVETYIPEFGGPYATPENGASKFFHFKFKNGASGFNVGLIRQTMQNLPSRWPMMIITEVNAAGTDPIAEVEAPAATDSSAPASSAPQPVDSVVGIPDSAHPGEFLPTDETAPISAGQVHVAANGTKYVAVAHGSAFIMIFRWKPVV